MKELHFHIKDGDVTLLSVSNLIKMNVRIYTICLFAFFVFTNIACSKNSEDIPDWFWNDSIETEESDSAIIALGWTSITDLGELPNYIKVYKSPSLLESKKAIAYIAVAEMDQGATFNALGDASGYKTPSDFYNESAASVILNAGYFYAGSSLSLLCRAGEILCPNNQVEGRNNWSVLYYPTRGVFGLMQDGTYQTSWVYTTDLDTYTYSLPSPNKSGEEPQIVPSKTFPEQGTSFKAETAIGAGPVLIKDGEIRNTYEAELFDGESGVAPESSNPRSAIGITSDNRLIFFVCEGRNMTSGVVGYTLAEVANIMNSLGCVEALNLDGGGSSCMLVNGKETIIPSDGSQRSIVTAVAIK
jgi:hypothetical protein